MLHRCSKIIKCPVTIKVRSHRIRRRVASYRIVPGATRRRFHAKSDAVKREFHDTDTDTDILARILADTSDTRDFLNLLL